MAITRIFRVRIVPQLRAEFEEKFASISVDAVTHAAGAISVRILKPTQWTPDKYAMISEWEDVEALRCFAGDQWSEAYIPPGIEKFVQAFWVSHYESWGISDG